jgi:uncharacterized membrane protein
MGNRIVNFVLLLGVIGVMVIGAAILADVTGALDIYRAQVAARQAEAEAAKLQAELELAQAQAQIETAAGERAVLEAAARSVDSDRRLVAWYSLRDDLRAILALVGAVGLAVTGGVIFILIKGVGNAKNTNTDQHE